MNKEILKLIKESKKDYDKKSQRGELLIRNEQFKNEFQKISSEFKEINIKKKREVKELVFLNDYGKDIYADPYMWIKFRKFCLRWHISTDWDGKINTVTKFIKETPQLIYNPIITFENGRVNFSDMEVLDPEEKDYLYIKIDAWTTLEQIKSIWTRIEKLQKSTFNFKSERKPKFGRDLCWYDLNKKFKLSAGKISKLWIEYCPDEIDMLVLRNLKKNNAFIKELRETIHADESLKELRGRVLEDKEILKEIKSGRLKEKFKSIFDQEKEFYTIGKTPRGKVPSLLKDLIKQAIRRMNSYIKQMSKLQSLYTFEEEIIHIPREVDKIDSD